MDAAALIPSLPPAAPENSTRINDLPANLDASRRGDFRSAAERLRSLPRDEQAAENMSSIIQNACSIVK
jgi:hypothetical protein